MSEPADTKAADTEPAHTEAEADLLAETTSRLDALRQRLVTAKTVPMSASVMVNKKETLAQIDELRAVVGAAFAEAASIRERQDDLIESGRSRAAELIAEARSEADDLVAAEAIHRRASAAATELTNDASQEIGVSRAQLDDYVDRKLAHLEVLLTRTLSQVTEGRRQLGEPATAGNAGVRAPLGALADDRHDDPPRAPVIRGEG